MAGGFCLDPWTQVWCFFLWLPFLSRERHFVVKSRGYRLKPTSFALDLYYKCREGLLAWEGKGSRVWIEPAWAVGNAVPFLLQTPRSCFAPLLQNPAHKAAFWESAACSLTEQNSFLQASSTVVEDGGGLSWLGLGLCSNSPASMKQEEEMPEKHLQPVHEFQMPGISSNAQFFPHFYPPCIMHCVQLWCCPN